MNIELRLEEVTMPLCFHTTVYVKSFPFFEFINLSFLFIQNRLIPVVLNIGRDKVHLCYLKVYVLRTLQMAILYINISIMVI